MLPFVCPLCASTVYEQVLVERPDRPPFLSSLYRCAGCSVVFTDREKFTRLARFKPGVEFTPRVIHGHREATGSESGGQRTEMTPLTDTESA